MYRPFDNRGSCRNLSLPLAKQILLPSSRPLIVHYHRLLPLSYTSHHITSHHTITSIIRSPLFTLIHSIHPYSPLFTPIHPFIYFHLGKGTSGHYDPHLNFRTIVAWRYEQVSSTMRNLCAIVDMRNLWET